MDEFSSNDLFIYLFQHIIEIHPCKNDIHPYELFIYGHIHPCRWIKITLSFKLQVQTLCSCTNHLPLGHDEG
jgi:hypothetical protein